MAPSFPITVTTELAFGADPDGDPAVWTWTNVSTDVLYASRVQIRRGTSDERAEAEPSQCQFTLNNPNGDYTPGLATGAHYPNVRLNVPVRVTVTTDGVDYRRFSGFVSSWQPQWPEGDLATPYALVRVTADGILRRMGQGADSLRSAIFRSVSTHPNVVAYWPCEDNEGATQAASPIDGVSPLKVQNVDFASVDGPPGSDRLLRVNVGSTGFVGRVPNHTPGTVYVVQLAWRMDDDPSAGRVMLQVSTTSADVAIWRIHFTDTTFNVSAWDAGDTQVVSSSESLNHDLFGQWVRVELRLRQGASISWSASIDTVDVDRTQLNSLSGSVSGNMGRILTAPASGGAAAQERSLGHIAVFTGTETELGFDSDQTAALLHPPFHGWSGELAADRFERLCDEEGLSCSIIAPTGGLQPFAGATTDNASTPDQASLRITGDIDLRGWLTAQDWSNSTFRELIHRWDTSVDQRSYMLEAGNSGRVALLWSTDGTSAGASFIQSTAQIPVGSGSGRVAVRGTLDVDNGASGHDVALYFGPSLDGPWTLLHSETITGVTSIHAGTADLLSGGKSGTITEITDDVVHAARVYDGIDGTLVADPDFEAQTIGATSFQDAQGNTWTVNGDAQIVRADDSMPMGPQRIDTLLVNLQDCASTDVGILGEDDFGLSFRTRNTLYDQTAALSLNSSELINPFDPVLDDQQVVNDVTVSPPHISSARLVDEADVTDRGRYDTDLRLNPSIVDWARQLAGWHLSLGTWPGMRYPSVSPGLMGTPTLITSWGVAALGDLVQVTNLPAQHPADTVDLLIRGWTETLASHEWLATINASPAGLYDVAVFDIDRFDTAGSETSGSFVAGTDTSLTVVTTATQPWVNSTDHAAEFPFEIEVSGVVLNVTAISGATSPQTFSVDATPVNGVTKTIPSGSVVQLASRPVFAL